MAHITVALVVFLAFIQQSTQHFEPFTNNANNPFGFINSLQGGMKGQKIDGLHKLKNYLAKFGYLENRHVSKNNAASFTKDNNDAEYFDNDLEKAIKTYQANYKLNVTGHLDAATVTQMMMPRCGFPDIINGKNTMQTKQKSRNHKRQSSMYGTSLYKFDGKWAWPSSKDHLTYKVLSKTLVPGTENMRVVVAYALNFWAWYSPFKFLEMYEENTTDLVFGFFEGDHGDGLPFDGPRGIIGHSFLPTDGRSHFDASENWSDTEPNQDQYDLFSVVMHGIGHSLGLQHSDDYNAVMYPSVVSGVKKRYLQWDDINGIRALYNSY